MSGSDEINWADEVEGNPWDALDDEWMAKASAAAEEETRRLECIRHGEALANLVCALRGRPNPNKSSDESKRTEGE